MTMSFVHYNNYINSIILWFVGEVYIVFHLLCMYDYVLVASIDNTRIRRFACFINLTVKDDANRYN